MMDEDEQSRAVQSGAEQGRAASPLSLCIALHCIKMDHW